MTTARAHRVSRPTHPTASSADGRTFRLEGAWPGLLPGDVVAASVSATGAALGQVRSRVAPDGSTHGVVLGLLEAGSGALSGRPCPPYRDMAVRAGDAAELGALAAPGRGDLCIGTWAPSGTAVPARLRAKGFNRHTFLCGQSGSGKTYALGVVLERLLLETDLRMVVLDPNADFVSLGTPTEDATPDDAARLTRNGVRVLGAQETGRQPLRLRFGTMPRRAQAALLHLDPLADREEYSHFVNLLPETGGGDVSSLITRLAAGDIAERALAQRIRNLGLEEWEVWARELPSAAEMVQQEGGTTVCDLSGFDDAAEPVAVCLDLVESLWAARESRTPTLLVIDEAHNLCPPQTSTPTHALLVDRLVQIAAEGRKYGLWLLLSTQRPSKVHPQVLSQCDNLILMRMNSAGDVAELVEAFGFAPPAMVEAAQHFRQGEALVAGAFVDVPSLIRVGERLTRQGGRDVDVPLVGGVPA